MPNVVLFDSEISSTSKLLYVLISSLCAEKGYCYASNQYLADKLGVNKTSISRLLKQLDKYLEINNPSNEKRTICLLKNQNVPSEKSEACLLKNQNHNNISNNNINEKETLPIKQQAQQLHEVLGHKSKLRSESHTSKLKTRLETFTYEEIERVAKALAKSEWHVKNGHNNLTVLLRNDEFIEKWLNINENKEKENRPWLMRI